MDEEEEHDNEKDDTMVKLENIYRGLRSKGKRNFKSVASVFFRFSHRDKDGNVIPNSQ